MPAPERLVVQIEKAFSYHRPSTEVADKCQAIRDKCKELAYFIAENTPESREQSLALTELEKVMFFGVSALVRK